MIWSTNDAISINKISQIHDGEKIIFCKTDFIHSEFEKIKLLKNDVILITGNSDYSIGDDLVALAPKNIKKWFCQNRLSENNILESIPIGLENSEPSKRHHSNSYEFSHGYVWDHAPLKAKKLFEKNKNSFTKRNLVYANFNIETNRTHRSFIKNILIAQSCVTWENPSNNYDQFIQGILDHEAVACPVGNGADTHRIYETAFLDRVAISFDPLQYRFIHNLFPVYLVTDISEFENSSYLKIKIDEAKNNFDRKHLLADFWIQKIIDSAKHYNVI
jgi:hypothetical protein